MAKLPIMPVIVDRLLADTEHLDNAEFGAYWRLLLHCWRHNAEPLPDDDKRLAQITRQTAGRWKRMRPAIAPFFKIADDGWHQERLEAEWKIAIEKSAKQSQRAKGIRQTTLPFGETAAETALTGDAAPARARPSHPKATSSPIEDSPPVSTPESMSASAAVDKRDEGNPVEHAARALAANYRPPYKTPALRAQIKVQCAWKHCRFLRARGRPGEALEYYNAIDPTTSLPPPELFEAIDARMRAARWDDMRAWKAQNGIAA